MVKIVIDLIQPNTFSYLIINFSTCSCRFLHPIGTSIDWIGTSINRLKIFCYKKLLWPFSVWIICDRTFFFFTIGQNNFLNKIPKNHRLSKNEYISIGLIETVNPFSTFIPSYINVNDICFTLSLNNSGYNSSKLTWNSKVLKM